MEHDITLKSVGAVTRALVEALYELAVQDDPALAEGVLNAAVKQLEGMVSAAETTPFATQIVSTTDASKLLTQFINQQVETLEVVHTGDLDAVRSILVDHLVALRKVAAFLRTYMEEGGADALC